MSFVVTLKPGRDRVQLVLTGDGDELLRASLPPPSQLSSCKPVPALLESLAIWLDAQLSVVLCASAGAAGFALGLTDELGTGLRTLFYEVRSVPRRRRPLRLRVADARGCQLSFLDRAAGGGR